MRKIKKLIAVILCAATLLSVYVPLASAEEIPEEITASQQTSQADSEGQDVELPEEEPEQNEETVEEELTESEEETEDSEETNEPETEQEIPQVENEESYAERVEYCVEEGLYNMGVGVAFIGMFFTSPLFFVIPPIGVVAMIGGLPVGLASLFVGAGEVVASPVLALFIDTDTSLVFI